VNAANRSTNIQEKAGKTGTDIFDRLYKEAEERELKQVRIYIYIYIYMYI